MYLIRLCCYLSLHSSVMIIVFFFPPKMENPSFRFTASQELVLKSTPEAVKVAADGPPASGAQGPPVRAKKWEEVEAEARARVVSEGGDPGAEMVVLSRCAVQFGKYRGQTFKWMMENDVGYMVHLVTVHQKERERERSVSQHPLMANKDALTRYSCAYPAFAEMVRFNRAHEEAKVLSSQPGQEGKALVGIGKYKWDTLQDLYEATGADRIKYVRNLRTQTPRYPGSAMAALIDYIQRRDREGAASTTPASTIRPKSAATPLGPAISAFLSRRSLAPGELQAKMKKLIASQPAVQGVSFPRPALPPTDISDAELVKAAADIDTCMFLHHY
uniref:uncharacterized protein LOC124030589 n=1 Tax=Oncorhynchus gorbuscha TaxID=8017 RepID=UPI001EAF841B|nr:uncharacterized protein LOC124030589 [Oncorhynchus gorbuscha]